MEAIISLPMATSQELRWGILLGMAIGGGLVSLVNYIRDYRRQHIDKLVEEKVERILALVEQRHAEVVRREEVEDETSKAASASSSSSSTGTRTWERKKPYVPSSAQKSSLLKTATTSSAAAASSSSSSSSLSPSSSSSSSSSSSAALPSSSSSSSSEPVSPTKSERPKLQKSYSTATIWRGEDEATLRKRQNLERQSSMQKLYGMEAEIAKKVEKKTEPLIEPMCKWLYEVVGEQVVEQFPDCLKSGRLLCALMNKLWPGIIPEVHTRPVPLLERENIQKYLDACAKMGIRKDDLFSVSDLYDEKYLAAVVQNVYAVARYVQQRKSWDGPLLLLPPAEKTAM